VVILYVNEFLLRGPAMPADEGTAKPPLDETHELRFVGTDEGQAVPASVLAEALQGAQRVVYLLAMARRRIALRHRARVPRDIESAFPVMCGLARAGSYVQPIRIGNPAASLLATDEISEVANDFDRVLGAAVRGDADEVAQALADTRWRAAVLDGIARMAPRPSSGFALSIVSRRLDRCFELSESRSQIEALALRRAVTAESRSLIGRLQAIDFGERRLTLLHPKTSRAFNCFYVDDLEPMLLENARQLIQVTGEVELDAQGIPVKVIEATDIRPVELDPIALTPFVLERQRIEPAAPRLLTPELDETEQMFALRDEGLGIDLVAETRAELEDALAHELRLLWRDYAQAPDTELTRDARALKQRLIAAFRVHSDAA
jgi:hypothetical protein